MDVFFVTIGFILKIFLGTMILNDSARSATYEVGSTVELKCKYSAFGEELKWYHLLSPNDVIYSINTVINPNLEGSIKARISITGNHSAGEYRLKISNLTMSDKGQYQCSISERFLHDEHTINIIDAPYVKVINVTYSQNDINRTITCEYIGNPITNIFYNWQQNSKYGIIIRKWDNMQSGVLTLPHIPVEKRYQDNGEYECTVRIDVNGNVIEKTGIGSMTVKASPVFTIDNDKTHIANVGGKAELHVNVYSFPKFTTMEWYKGNKIISSSFKYRMSDEPGRVRDRFHTTDVVLDGYIFSLNISNLTVDDITSYMIELSNNIGGSVNYTITLESFGKDRDTMLPLNASPNALIGGVAGSLGFIVIVTLIMGYICIKRRKASRKDNISMQCVLYQSGGSGSSCKSGPDVEYDEVVKKTDRLTSPDKITSNENNPVAVSAEVNKGEKQKQNKAQKQKALKKDPSDGKAGFSVKKDDGKKCSTAEHSEQTSRKENPLEYADLSFANQKSGTTDVIRGDHGDKIVYSEVDHSKKASLPSSLE